MQETDLADTIGKILLERDKRADGRDFRRWCNCLLSTPLVPQKEPKTNFKVDIELQPLRWMSLGILLLQSRKGVAPMQLAGGFEGPPMKTYLPYPVFQLATEVFLKGMWLCQFRECRALHDHFYVNSEAREVRFKQLQNDLGHDLIRILDAVRKIRRYRNNAPSMRFFDLIERIVKVYYFPLSQGAKRNRWAAHRYPIRFYDDVSKDSRANFLETFPLAQWIERLFRAMEARTDHLWRLRAGLSGKTKTTAKATSHTP